MSVGFLKGEWEWFVIVSIRRCNCVILRGCWCWFMVLNYDMCLNIMNDEMFGKFW